MPKDDYRAVQSQKAAKLLKRAYRRLKVKSWQKVADRYGLANKARAYMIASGQMQVNPAKDHQLMRALLREDETRRAPVKMRRLIRRIAVPFLARRQRSAGGVYAHGGAPVERGVNR